MDRRREPRFSTYQTVLLVVLGDLPFSCRANLIQLSGRGLRMVLQERVAIDSLVRVDAADWIAFGEVCYCIREMSHYALGLQLDQAILHPVLETPGFWAQAV